ncbi:uncharacterized protein [Salvelinus alpinus]|uniref:uncharacterized protein isoform X2 n=1 Tax=Salvelinus alpinus TaxID=8036 RepID=UPI0039FC471B
MSGDGRRKRDGDDNGWASRGGYMAAKVSKLDEQFKLDAPREKLKYGACSSIFTGVAIYVKGYTEPSVDELRRLMLLHGGQFHVYYSQSNTTHIIATNLPNSKIQELRDQKVVRPEWITDSIKAGHLLSYLQYQLYAKQKGLSFPSVSVHQGQEPAGPLHGHLLTSHSLPLPSLNNHNPAPSRGQPLSRHHTPTSSHSHLYTDNLHPQPNHYNPLASHRSPQPSHSLPSHLGPQPSHSLPSHLNPQPSHSLPSHRSPQPSHSLPSHLGHQPSHSLPSHLGPQPSHSLPSHLGPQPSHSLPSHLGPQPSHSLPSHLGPQPSHSLPSHRSPQPSHSLPSHLGPQPSHSLPSHLGPQPSHSLPSHLGPQPSHSLPSHLNPQPSHSLPSHLGPQPSHSLPSHLNPQPSHSLPSHLNPQPSHSLPSHLGPQPSHSLPSHLGPQPSHSLPSHLGPQPSHSLPSHRRPQRSHSLPSHRRPQPSHSLPGPQPSHSLPSHRRPQPSHSLPGPQPSHSLPSHRRPQPSHSLPSHRRPQPSHSLPSHRRPQPSHSLPSHFGPQPSHSLPGPQPSHFLPSHLGPQPSQLEPQPSQLGSQSRHLTLGPSLLGPFSSNHLYSDPGHITHHPPSHGQPKLDCIQPPPSAYTHPQTPGPVPANPSHEHSKPGQAQPPSVLCISSHLQHSYRELDFRLNGSLLPSYEKTRSVKMNGVQELGGEDPCPVRTPRGVKDPCPVRTPRGVKDPCPVRTPRGVKDPCPVRTPRGVNDPTLTNGHAHPVNGAIKSLDLSPNPTRPTPTPDRGLPHTLQSIPPQPDSPLSKPPIQHDTPRPPPVSHHRHHAQPANEQRPKAPPPTYQETMAVSASRPLDLPPQSDFPPEKQLPPANPNPSPSPVCLNGSHHNVFPSNPTPLETNSLSANTFPSNPTPLETNSLSANTFPFNPTPLETNSLSTNTFPSNPTPLETNNLSANTFPSNPSPLETNSLSANTFPSNPTPLETNSLSANTFPSNPTLLETNSLSANTFPSNPTPLETNSLSANTFPSNPTPLETNSLSANTFPSNPTLLETNSLSANTFPSNPTPLETNSLSANPIPSNYAPPHHDQQSAKVKTGGIIAEFYCHSRLHHISTWRSEFSEYVNTLQSRRRATGGATFPGRDRLRRQRREGLSAAPGPQSCILHVDMDCFFVSVGIRHRPDLKGKSVAVTSNRGPGRVAQRAGVDHQLELQYYQKKYSYPAVSERKDGDLEEMTSSETESHISHGNSVDQDTAALSMAEIASCSYEARLAGVRNGMFFGQAKQLCPSLQSVPYDFQAYKKVALAMYETLASYSHDIEALSCDEALVDSSALLAELSVTPDELASAIRADVRERTGCSASVGMGSNILLARMATRKAKPNGQYLLRSEEVDDFIRDQTVTSLPGVGRSMGGKLASLGVRSCGDLQQVSLQRLQKEFGPRTGQTLFRFCRGLDDRPVRSEKERKSVSAEMNYNIRFTQVDEAESFLTHLSIEVQKRLRGAGLRGRRLTLKVMVCKAGAPVEPSNYSGHGTCDNLARSVTLAQLTDCGHLIASEVIKLFHTMRLKVQDLRGVGLQVQLLEGVHSVPKDPSGPKTSIRDKLLAQRHPAQPNHTDSLPNTAVTDTCTSQENSSSARVLSPFSTPRPTSPAEPIPGTSKGEPPPSTHTPNHVGTRLNLSIEVSPPSQVDRSVLEALPAELREQVEHSWTHRDTERTHNGSHQRPLHHGPSSPLSSCSSSPLPSSPPPPAAPPVGALVLQIPNQSGQTGSTGIILELPDFSQVDPEVFAALPRELQEELRSAYGRIENAQAKRIMADQRNPLLHLKHVGVGRMKHCYKKSANSPANKGPSPLKRPRPPGNTPAKDLPHVLRPRDLPNGLKLENGPSTSPLQQDDPETLSKFTPRPEPTLAGACDFMDIRTLLREWVTTISDPMEEDILQVVKYCTDLINDKDLEKLDLIIKYMKRLMQQSVESVWSMAFDFILDNVQVVVQQTYGSTLKIT